MSGQVFVFIPLLYVALQWAALSRMRDGWHTAARLPAICMGLALVLLAFGIATRTDVALLGLILGLPLATIYLVILWPLHLLVKGPG